MRSSVADGSEKKPPRSPSLGVHEPVSVSSITWASTARFRTLEPCVSALVLLGGHRREIMVPGHRVSCLAPGDDLDRG